MKPRRDFNLERKLFRSDSGNRTSLPVLLVMRMADKPFSTGITSTATAPERGGGGLLRHGAGRMALVFGVKVRMEKEGNLCREH